MVSISERTYWQLVACLQAHAPADAGAREVLAALQQEVLSHGQPDRFALQGAELEMHRR